MQLHGVRARLHDQTQLSSHDPRGLVVGPEVLLEPLCRGKQEVLSEKMKTILLEVGLVP